MSFDEFKYILSKLKGYTNYIYLHVLGEPLMHPLINEFINYASKFFYVNITTNGTLLNKIKDNKNIRQINVSMHSMNNYDLVFKYTDILKKCTYINYRFWVGEYKEKIKILENKYNIEINKSMKLENNVFVDIKDEFVWPDLSNNLCNDGKCYGLIDHFGILVDGRIIPCCLDSLGSITLGNIFTDNLEEVFNSNRVKDIKNNFKNGKRIEELCKHCGFKIGGYNE